MRITVNGSVAAQQGKPLPSSQSLVLSGTATVQKQITLSWAVKGRGATITAFNLYDENNNPILMNTKLKTYVVKNLNPNTRYCFTVQPASTYVATGLNSKCITTMEAPVIPPTSPSVKGTMANPLAEYTSKSVASNGDTSYQNPKLNLGSITANLSGFAPSPAKWCSIVSGGNMTVSNAVMMPYGNIPTHYSYNGSTWSVDYSTAVVSSIVCKNISVTATSTAPVGTTTNPTNIPATTTSPVNNPTTTTNSVNPSATSSVTTTATTSTTVKETATSTSTTTSGSSKLSMAGFSCGVSQIINAGGASYTFKGNASGAVGPYDYVLKGISVKNSIETTKNVNNYLTSQLTPGGNLDYVKSASVNVTSADGQSASVTCRITALRN